MCVCVCVCVCACVCLCVCECVCVCVCVDSFIHLKCNNFNSLSFSEGLLIR